VSTTLQHLEGLRATLARSDSVGSLRERVDHAIVQAAQAERVFLEVKQRLEVGGGAVDVLA
jgi:hypothetical protein